MLGVLSALPPPTVRLLPAVECACTRRQERRWGSVRVSVSIRGRARSLCVCVCMCVCVCGGLGVESEDTYSHSAVWCTVFQPVRLAMRKVSTNSCLPMEMLMTEGRFGGRR
jgi:hypothetical protein